MVNPYFLIDDMQNARHVERARIYKKWKMLAVPLGREGQKEKAPAEIRRGQDWMKRFRGQKSSDLGLPELTRSFKHEA